MSFQIAFRDAAAIFPSRAFLRVAEEVRTCNIVVKADLSSALTADVPFSPIGADAVA